MSFQLETKRLIIRDVREEDIPVLIEQFAEIEARENILSVQWDKEHNRRDLEGAIAWAAIEEARREYYKVAVELKADGTLIGTCILTYVRAGSFETNIGWHFGHQFRNNGYATEAAREMVRFGFERRKVNEIYADCFEKNRASIRVMEKIGLKPSFWNFGVANIIRGITWGEYDKPTVRYSLSRYEWLAQQKSKQD